jgi:hypothetical protein
MIKIWHRKIVSVNRGGVLRCSVPLLKPFVLSRYTCYSDNNCAFFEVGDELHGILY